VRSSKEWLDHAVRSMRCSALLAWSYANGSMTMRIYTKTQTSAKWEAQSRVVDVLLDRSRNVAGSATEDAAWEPMHRVRHDQIRIGKSVHGARLIANP
jgi:hypothetical protein